MNLLSDSLFMHFGHFVSILDKHKIMVFAISLGKPSDIGEVPETQGTTSTISMGVNIYVYERQEYSYVYYNKITPNCNNNNMQR